MHASGMDESESNGKLGFVFGLNPKELSGMRHRFNLIHFAWFNL